MSEREFHWGATPESDAFFERHPKFLDAFERLMQLANRMFGREYHPKNRLGHTGFKLGQTCRVDFLETSLLPPYRTCRFLVPRVRAERHYVSCAMK